MTQSGTKAADNRDIEYIVRYVDVDIDPDFDRDPHGPLTRLMEKTPVVSAEEASAAGVRIPDNFLFEQAGRQVYFALSFDAARKVATDAKAFSNELAYGVTLRKTFGKTLMSMDGDEHTQMKKLVLPSFGHRIVNEDFTKLARPIIENALNGFAKNGKGELVSDFTVKFPFAVIADIFGVPRHLAQEAEDLTLAATSMGKDPEKALAALRGMDAMYQQVVDDHREHPKDDMVSALLNTEIEGVRLSDEDVVSLLKQIVAAALDTTVRQTANLIYLLLQNPAEFQKLKRQPELLENAVFEGMRFESAGGFIPRVATQDVDVSGVSIPEGAGVYAIIHSANRDPQRWENPNSFDISRQRKQFMTLGGGAHACLGANLTLLEQKIAMTGLLARLKNLKMDPDLWKDIEVRGFQLRSVNKLPVQWDVA